MGKRESFGQPSFFFLFFSSLRPRIFVFFIPLNLELGLEGLGTSLAALSAGLTNSVNVANVLEVGERAAVVGLEARVDGSSRGVEGTNAAGGDVAPHVLCVDTTA
eukprot:TRINITY_DN1784_c0_g1_i2.p1 TRINITY_DN1784_c0_g1~~TRINITY_DN1784_c0_g1_i2.p1  ORF type:complete len:105 (+),score=2.90 TRINITY_DN1784_c0_g1_i2:317-631(+)